MKPELSEFFNQIKESILNSRNGQGEIVFDNHLLKWEYRNIIYDVSYIVDIHIYYFENAFSIYPTKVWEKGASTGNIKINQLDSIKRSVERYIEKLYK